MGKGCVVIALGEDLKRSRHVRDAFVHRAKHDAGPAQAAQCVRLSRWIPKADRGLQRITVRRRHRLPPPATAQHVLGSPGKLPGMDLCS